MVKTKTIRKRGKLNFSRAFQDLVKGDDVTVVIEKSKQPKFPKRLQGRTGRVEEKRGNCAVVKIRNMSKEKTFIIDPIHLKKINKPK